MLEETGDVIRTLQAMSKGVDDAEGEMAADDKEVERSIVQDTEPKTKQTLKVSDTRTFLTLHLY